MLYPVSLCWLKLSLLKKALALYVELKSTAFAARPQQTDGHLLCENKVKKSLKYLIFLTGTLIPTASRSEEQAINVASDSYK
jgi:hypothetical protein